MPVPIAYRKSGESPIASYTFSEISEGTGFVKFYGFTTKALTTISYKLSSNASYSNDIQTATTIDNATPDTLFKTFNFDLSQFNLPQLIKGKSLLNIPVEYIGGAGSGIDIYWVCDIVRLRGAVETTIGTITSETTRAGDAETVEKIHNLAISITGTLFKKGDVLRLKLKLYGKRDAGNNGVCTLFHDPQNRSTTATILSTKLECYIPFRIDL